MRLKRCWGQTRELGEQRRQPAWEAQGACRKPRARVGSQQGRLWSGSTGHRQVVAGIALALTALESNKSGVMSLLPLQGHWHLITTMSAFISNWAPDKHLSFSLRQQGWPASSLRDPRPDRDWVCASATRQDFVSKQEDPAEQEYCYSPNSHIPTAWSSRGGGGQEKTPPGRKVTMSRVFGCFFLTLPSTLIPFE